jgi:hypothetical protein
MLMTIKELATMLSTILRVLAAVILMVVAVLPAAEAADSTSFGLADVPWQKPYARQADIADTAGFATSAGTLQGMPTSCPEGQVLSVAAGALTCVEASSSTTVNQCSASVTLVVGKTYKTCCDAGGTVTSIGGGSSICKFSGASCPGGWSSYSSWSTTSPSSCNGYAVCASGDQTGGTSCSTSSHAFSNVTAESCAYTQLSCSGSWLFGSFSAQSCVASTTERGCV